MQDTLKIAAIQADLAWEDPEANRAYFDQKISEIDGVDLIVLPEMFATGFSMNPEGIADTGGGKPITYPNASTADCC